jgi:hypothetical protein
MDAIINQLDSPIKEWASQLSTGSIANILKSAYYQTLTPPASLAPAIIGKQAEDLFEQICSKLPGNFTLVNTAKQGKSGDFVISYKNKSDKVLTCLVDIKKYTGKVPKKEIDKFNKDLIFSTHDAGLIVSFTSKFVGVNDSIHLAPTETPHGSIPVMYLAEMPESLIVDAIKILMLSAEARVEKQVAVDGLLVFINSSLAQSAMTRRMLSDLALCVSTQIQSCQENLLMLETTIKHAVSATKT